MRNKAQKKKSNTHNSSDQSTDILQIVNDSLSRLQSIENDLDLLRYRLEQIVIPEAIGYTWPEAITWFRKNNDKLEKEEKLKKKVKVLKQDQKNIIAVVKQHMINEGMGEAFEDFMRSMQQEAEDLPDA